MSKIQHLADRNNIKANLEDGWGGLLYFWPEHRFYIGGADSTVPHASHDVAISIAIHGEIRVQNRANGRWGTYQAAIIPPDMPHIYDGRDAKVIMLYFPAERFKSQRLLFDDDMPQPLSQRLINRFLPPLQKYLDNGCAVDEALEWSNDIIEQVVRGDLPKLSLDARIQETLELLHSDPGGKFSVADICQITRLSAGRFSHLFSEQIGLPFREYLLSLRLRFALNQVASGYSLTNAAHEAGFADLAHFSRTFRREIGVSPSTVLKRSLIFNQTE